MRSIPPVIALACVAMVFSAGTSRAGVIYSNFGSGNSFDPDDGEPISDSSVGYEPSFQFTPSDTGVLGEVDFVASIGLSGDLNQITVVLSNDDGGQPGTAIASQEFDDQMGVLGVNSQIISWLPSTSLALDAGTPYWITLESPVPGDVFWNFNNQSQFGDSVFSSGEWEATDNTLGALQIIEAPPDDTGPSTPEPASFLTVGTGLAGLLAFIRRREFAN